VKTAFSSRERTVRHLLAQDIPFVATAALGLVAISRYNYLLFHSLAEASIAALTFNASAFAWNSRRFQSSGYLLWIGLALGGVGMLGILHAMAYKGVNVFPDADANLPTQIWIASRYLIATVLLIAPFFLKRPLPLAPALTGLGATLFALTFAVFTGHFPDCYVEGIGLTRFKVASEYIVSAMLIAAMARLWQHRRDFEPLVLRLLGLFFAFSIAAELALTSYVGVYDVSNLVGHLLQLLAMYVFYKAIVETGITRPFELMFRELNLEKSRLMAILSQLPDGVVIAEAPSGKLVLRNPQVDALLGGFVACEDIEGYNLYQGAHTDGKPYRSEEWPMARSLRDGAIVRDEEITFTCFDGTQRSVSISSAPIRDHAGEIIAGVAIHHDVTERRRIESELQAAVKARDEFLCIASHELKTPLTPLKLQIQSFHRAIEQGHLEELGAPRIRDMSRVALRQIDKLSSLIESLLDVTRISAGKLHLDFRKVDLSALITEIVDRHQDQIRETRCEVRLHHDVEPVIGRLDPIRIEQVVTNLLINALKYAPACAVEVGVTRETPAQVRLWVRDQGPGIPPEAQTKIFHRFERVGSPKEVGGLGLGLYISKQIVEAHGGSIELDSAPGRGTLFLVRLPL
jgi:PAS domain S-box-containing protein